MLCLCSGKHRHQGWKSPEVAFTTPGSVPTREIWALDGPRLPVKNVWFRSLQTQLEISGCCFQCPCYCHCKRLELRKISPFPQLEVTRGLLQNTQSRQHKGDWKCLSKKPQRRKPHFKDGQTSSRFVDWRFKWIQRCIQEDDRAAGRGIATQPARRLCGDGREQVTQDD